MRTLFTRRYHSSPIIPQSGMAMKKRYVLLVAGMLSFASACNIDKFVDVNTSPNAPQVVSANLYLPPLVHWLATSPQYDGRFVGRYTQEWFLVTTNLSTWDRMGYDPSSDNAAQQWRDVYWTFGQNLVDMMTKSEAEQRWDLLGVGYVLKAWGFQVITDLHGEIIVKEAFNQGTSFSFNYDTQDYAYTEIQRLLGEAIKNLSRTDGAVDQAYLAKGDHMYNGDRAKWLKLAYGMLAINLNHYSNKSAYKPADVVTNIDKSFASNADDALMSYPNVDPGNQDRNFLGPTRGNFPSYRQTRFVVGLLNGTVFGTPDPRLSKMLSPSPDGQYRGVDPNVVGFGALTTTQQPNNPYGLVASLSGLGQPGRYIFSDKVKFPVYTYAQLQFVKAEALYRSGDKAGALLAYKNAISAHIDFVNSRNAEEGTLTQITSTEKAAFLADPNIVPAAAANLTLTQIMSQKYIAQWAWGHNELWMDMRRYHYTDVDPASGMQVYPGFTPPALLYPDNSGKVVQRIRPRYNSEYVWNIPGLTAIGGLALDYHTKPLWITQP
ncbi:SusD/RagB family nutrient-binding outer membrane lipoprotein [soil metagenome]